MRPLAPPEADRAAARRVDSADDAVGERSLSSCPRIVDRRLPHVDVDGDAAELFSIVAVNLSSGLSCPGRRGSSSSSSSAGTESRASGASGHSAAPKKAAALK